VVKGDLDNKLPGQFNLQILLILQQIKFLISSNMAHSSKKCMHNIKNKFDEDLKLFALKIFDKA
jgi:hypothetical protein